MFMIFHFVCKWPTFRVMLKEVISMLKAITRANQWVDAIEKLQLVGFNDTWV